jgi:hypothetical protein
MAASVCEFSPQAFGRLTSALAQEWDFNPFGRVHASTRLRPIYSSTRIVMAFFPIIVRLDLWS